jgi:hypothetical protein
MSKMNEQGQQGQQGHPIEYINLNLESRLVNEQ